MCVSRDGSVYARAASSILLPAERSASLSPTLNVRPDKPNDCRDQCDFNNEMKTMESLFEAWIGVPAFAELHACVRQREAPWPRSDKCVDVKAELRHLRNARGKCNEGANHRQ